MEGEEIGMVMARASELKAKFTHLCIHRCKVFAASNKGGVGEGGGAVRSKEEVYEEEDENGDGDGESLASIRDALEALEQQLSALQF